MEIIIFVAVVVVAALLWNGYVKTKKTESDQAIDDWKPISADKPWPYGEKLSEGKIHVKTTDVAPGKSADDRVEASAPVPLVPETAPVKKAAAKKPAVKKTAAKPVAAKRAPAKKKSV